LSNLIKALTFFTFQTQPPSRKSQLKFENVEKSDSLIKFLEYFAIKYFFGEEICENLHFYYEEEEWKPEEIIRGGILSSYKEERIEFTHQTFPEFLVGNFTSKMIKNVKNPSKSQIELLVKILTKENFTIQRIFLNDLLKNFEIKSLKIFQSRQKFQENFKNNFKGLQALGQEGFEFGEICFRNFRIESRILQKFH
jgi:hypothetical protein